MVKCCYVEASMFTAASELVYGSLGIVNLYEHFRGTTRSPWHTNTHL